MKNDNQISAKLSFLDQSLVLIWLLLLMTFFIQLVISIIMLDVYYFGLSFLILFMSLIPNHIIRKCGK